MIKTYKNTQNLQLSKNFALSEFKCKCKKCNTTLVDPLLVAYLQKIRDFFGAKVTINSGYRCDFHNKAVGGSENSLHKSGSAADISVSGIEPSRVAAYAEQIGVRGIGLYNWGCHIDTRIKKFFWYSDKQTERITFADTAFIVRDFQKAAISDGFTLKCGADSLWGIECETVAKKAVLKKRLTYKYKNLTAFVQNLLNITPDGKFGPKTRDAVISYQLKNSLTPDGKVGINTYKSLIGVK